MLEVKLSDLRHPAFFINQTDIVHIVDSRKKKEVGFFIPASLSASFSEYLMQQEKQKKLFKVLILLHLALYLQKEVPKQHLQKQYKY